jgi:ankyrin repeat protein
MSLQRSATKRVAPGGAAPTRPKKGYEVVQQGIRQLYPEPDSVKQTDLDIVFVPGLGANPVESWKCSKTGFNWASDKDGIVKEFPSARVLLYMYQSAWVGPLKVKQFIGNLALTLLEGLQEKRASGSSRPIVFVGHSMGGLVIAKAVCLAVSFQDRFPNMFEDITGCAVFGTPFHGAEAASVAAMLSHVGQLFNYTVPSKLLNLMKPDDEGLAELRDEFVRTVTKLSPNVLLIGFYEEQPTDISDLSGVPDFIKALQIPLPKKLAEFVTKESAILGGLMTPMGLACNHRDLVKFESSKDERLSLVRGPIKRILRAAHLAAKSRRQSTRNIDKTLAPKVTEALDGAQVSRKRRAIASTTTPSAWVLDELDSMGWLVKNGSDHVSSPKKGMCVWIRGPDGRGKTSASLAALEGIDQMIESSPESAPTLLAYFFCENSPEYGTAEEVLKSIVQQLITKHDTLATHAKFLFRKRGKDDFKGQPQLTVENLWQALQDMLTDDSLFGSHVYFVVNNLQALPTDSDSTTTLLDLLKGEIENLKDSSRPTKVRWLVTSGESYSISRALSGSSVSLIDLQDPKYEDQVQLELRKHAQKKVTDLVAQKSYSKALAYFASSILGKRAQNTQWIDITCVQLEGLSLDRSDLHVRRLLEAVPQDLETLLDHAWRQVLERSREKEDEIKEILRVLVLTYEDPTEEELALLVGLYSTEKRLTEIHALVDHCKPLLCLKSSRSETRVCFIEGVVRTYLCENSHRLLGLSEDDTKLQHGMMALRSFTHIMDTLNFPVVEAEMVEEDGDAQKDGVESEDGSEHSEIDDEGQDAATDYNDDDNDAYSSDEDDDLEDEADEDPEALIIMNKSLAYPVKHWLHHASKATLEIAEDLSLEQEFWNKDSIIRRRWLTEYVRLTSTFKYWSRAEFSGLHVASSLGFRQLVASLIRNGHEADISLRDSYFYTPLHLAANFGRLNIVDELLDKGASINDGLEDGRMTPLHMAASEGHVKVMSKLLERGADPNASCGDYGMVINAAIESGNCDAVKLLVEKNVSLATEEEAEGDNADGKEENDGSNDVDNDEDDDGEDNDDGELDEDEEDEEDEEEEEEEEVIKSPLALAALRSDLTMFEFLVNNYSDRIPLQEFNTALVKAAAGGRMEVLKLLLESYSHPRETFQEALDQASDAASWDAVAALLEKCPGLSCDYAFVNASLGGDEDQEIQTLEALWEYSQGNITQAKLDEALYEATDFENSRTVQLLIRFGASPDATGSEYGTALTAAAYDGSLNIVTMLVDAGANINAPDGWALQAAASEGHLDIVEYLLSKGANVNATTTHEDMPECTALQAAVEYGYGDIVELLLEHGANPDLGGGELHCPIIAAAHNNEEDMLEALLKAKAKVDVEGEESSTPLINAAKYMPQSSMQSLLNAGADINLADKSGNTALMMAAYNGDSESVQTLLDHGADVLRSNNDGQNALQQALAGDDDDCIRIIVDHVSMIMAALRNSIIAGDPAVTAVIRGVESRNQGLDYDDAPRPMVHSQEETTNGTVHIEPRVAVVEPEVSFITLPGQDMPKELSTANVLAIASGQSEDLEASIRRIIQAPTWQSETSNYDGGTYDSRYSDTSVQTYQNSPVIVSDPSSLFSPVESSLAPTEDSLRRSDSGVATPTSASSIKRKPAPAAFQAYSRDSPSGTAVPELPGAVPYHPGGSAALQPSIPFAQGITPYQAASPSGTSPHSETLKQARYSDSSAAQSKQYQAYQAYQPIAQSPATPQQQYYQQQQQQQHQMIASRPNAAPQYQSYQRAVAGSPAQHLPYVPPGHQPPERPPKESMEGYGYDSNGRPAVDSRQRPTSYQGPPATWQSGQRY